MNLIKTKNHRRWAERIITEGIQPVVNGIATESEPAPRAGRSFIRSLVRSKVIRAWSWETDGCEFIPSDPNSGAALMLPGPKWHLFIKHAQESGIEVKPLKESDF